MTGTLGLHSETWGTVLSDSSVLILRQHIFWHAWWDTEHQDVREGRSVGKQLDPIDKEKLKEEHKEELEALKDAFEQQCLLSFSTNRSGEVIKKFNFPTFVPYEEAQKEDRMIHQMN